VFGDIFRCSRSVVDDAGGLAVSLSRVTHRPRIYCTSMAWLTHRLPPLLEANAAVPAHPRVSPR
jgi:hypothetical protein